MLRSRLVYGALALLFAGLGVLHFENDSETILVDNGALPTIAELEAEAAHLEGKDCGTPLYKDAILNGKTDSTPMSKDAILHGKTDGTPLYKDGLLDAKMTALGLGG